LGRLVVIEGIDGSGKSTQFKLLCGRLEREARDFMRVTFPQYSEPSSALVKMYLSGEFGTDPEDVNAYAASSFFAVDRFASYKKQWQRYFECGGTVLTDRYTTSNAIHQGSKLEDSERTHFFTWLYEYEFGLLRLPRPTAVIYLDVPVEVSVARMRLREKETGAKADIHETDTEYLRKCADCGRQAAVHYGWHTVSGMTVNREKSEEELHAEIYRLFSEQ